MQTLFDIGITCIAVLITVGIHFEILLATTARLHRAPRLDRSRVALGILAAMVAHMIEIFVFTLAWILMERMQPGRFSIADPGFEDMLYYALATYTSLGYGDISTTGFARVVSGIQGLTGLVLIGWTASFTYLEMRECWAGAGKD
jgi:Ion channel